MAEKRLPPILTILVPALNEQDRIEPSVLEALRAAELCKIPCEVIIVDDGSTDETFLVAQRLAKVDFRVRVIRNSKNLGLGGAYKVGLSAAQGKFVTWLPSDQSHPADGLLPAYQEIGSADIILPVPSNPEARGWIRRLISVCYTSVINVITGFNVPYYNGLSIHRVNLLRRIFITTDSFAFQAEAIVKLMFCGATYKVVDSFITDRQVGHTTAFRIKNIVAVLKTLMHLLKQACRQRFINSKIGGFFFRFWRRH